MIESVIYQIVKIFSAFLMLLPTGAALFIGRFIGRMAYYGSARRRRVAYNNLRIAFTSTKTDLEIRRILKKCYLHFGQNVVELLRLPMMARKGCRRWVRVENEEYFQEAIARKKGVIFLAMHSGNWELSSLVGSATGHPYNLIANPQPKTVLLDRLLTAYRKAVGCSVIHPGEATREVIRKLKANEIVSLVIDQGGKDGQLVDFLGRQASMSTGAIRLALKYDASICLVDIYREPSGRHCLSVDKPLELIRTGNDQQDIAANLKVLVKRCEKKIISHPHEYMWFYKIWKYSKQVNILILDDGRTGHLRQSQALAAIMMDTLAKKGKTAVVNTVTIRFKSDLMRRLSVVVSFLSQFLGGLRSAGVLRSFLKRSSFDRLISFKADYILSCGSSVAGVNYLSSAWQSAKSLVVLKPNILAMDRFDCVVLPEHDLAVQAPSKAVVARTRAALNLINKDYMAEQSELLLNRFSHLKNSYRTKIGVLIGGNTKNVEFAESAIKMVIHQLKEVAIQLNADILLTTSRRTPDHIEQIIWRELKKFDRCPLLISASNSDVPEAVGGILGLADCLLVSSESISMVSEAVCSGKKTVVFNVVSNDRRSQGSNKYERFVDDLGVDGHLIFCSTKGISQALYGVMSDKIYLKPINDQKSVAEVIERIV